jgi:HAD superfamily hydrolase (TIGR01490 family)
MGTTSSADSNPGKYTAFFDLDRTIISSNSGKALIMHAYKNGYLTHAGLVKSLYLSLLYKYNLRDTVEIITALASWLKGLHDKELTKISSEIFRDQLKDDIRPEIIRELQFHKKNGGKTVILSSALKPVCQAVAGHLEIDDIICSELESFNGKLTGKPINSFCFGKEKLIRAEKYCENNNTTLQSAWYYTDSISDMPLLSIIGTPVCVSPDRELMKKAVEKGWKIIQAAF